MRWAAGKETRGSVIISANFRVVVFRLYLLFVGTNCVAGLHEEARNVALW